MIERNPWGIFDDRNKNPDCLVDVNFDEDTGILTAMGLGGLSGFQLTAEAQEIEKGPDGKYKRGVL